MPATWIWTRVHGTHFYAVLWRCGDDVCLSRAVVDDFGQLVLL